MSAAFALVVLLSAPQWAEAAQAATSHVEPAAGVIVVAQNPFTGAPAQPQRPERAERENKPQRSEPGWYGRALATISGWQRELRSLLSRQARAIKESPSAYFSFLLLAMGYGALHALGPGHGKGFACAYFGSRRARLWHGVVLSGATSALHVASAAALVVVGYTLLDAVGPGDMQARSLFLQRASYGVLAVLGLAMAALAAWKMIRTEADSHSECPEASLKSMAGLILAVGLVPCPGAAIVLLFCLNLGLPAAGAAAMVAIALGMTLATGAVSVTAIAGSRGVASMLPLGAKEIRIAHQALSMAGGMLICAMGWALYQSAN